LDLHSYGYTVGGIFFGLWMVGYLLFVGARRPSMPVLEPLR
jgi:hypothetical protein